MKKIVLAKFFINLKNIYLYQSIKNKSADGTRKIFSSPSLTKKEYGSIRVSPMDRTRIGHCERVGFAEIISARKTNLSCN